MSTTNCSTPPRRMQLLTPNAPRIVRVRDFSNFPPSLYNQEDSPMTGIVKGTMNVCVSSAKRDSTLNSNKLKRKHSQEEFRNNNNNESVKPNFGCNPFAKRYRPIRTATAYWPVEDLFNAKNKMKKEQSKTKIDQIKRAKFDKDKEIDVIAMKKKKLLWFRNVSF